MFYQGALESPLEHDFYKGDEGQNWAPKFARSSFEASADKPSEHLRKSYSHSSVELPPGQPCGRTA